VEGCEGWVEEIVGGFLVVEVSGGHDSGDEVLGGGGVGGDFGGVPGAGEALGGLQGSLVELGWHGGSGDRVNRIHYWYG